MKYKKKNWISSIILILLALLLVGGFISAFVVLFSSINNPSSFTLKINNKVVEKFNNNNLIRDETLFTIDNVDENFSYKVEIVAINYLEYTWFNEDSGSESNQYNIWTNVYDKEYYRDTGIKCLNKYFHIKLLGNSFSIDFSNVFIEDIINELTGVNDINLINYNRKNDYFRLDITDLSTMDKLSYSFNLGTNYIEIDNDGVIF